MSASSIFKAVFSVLVLPNLVGNSLVILVILKSPAMKTPMNYLLLNLAVSDLLMGVAMLPRFILSDIIHYPRGQAGDILCKVLMLGNFGWVGAISSILSLLLISIERFFAVVKPRCIRHRITNKRLKRFVPITWTAAAVFCIPIFYVSHFDRNVTTCIYTWPAAWCQHTYNGAWLLVAAVLPTSIMTVLYARVAYFLWSDTIDGSNVTLQAVRRSWKKVTLTMLGLSVVYAVCWFPERIMNVVSNAAPEQFWPNHPAHNVAIFLVVVNSSVNPIVYAFRFEQFKRELVKIVSCGGKFFHHIHVSTRESELDRRNARETTEAETFRSIFKMRVITAPEQAATARYGAEAKDVTQSQVPSVTIDAEHFTPAEDPSLTRKSRQVMLTKEARSTKESEAFTPAETRATTAYVGHVTPAKDSSLTRESRQVMLTNKACSTKESEDFAPAETRATTASEHVRRPKDGSVTGNPEIRTRHAGRRSASEPESKDAKLVEARVTLKFKHVTQARDARQTTEPGHVTQPSQRQSTPATRGWLPPIRRHAKRGILPGITSQPRD